MLELNGIRLNDDLIAVKSRDIKNLNENDEFNVVVYGVKYKFVVSKKEKKFFGNRNQHYYYSYIFKCLSHNIKLTEYS